jgi:hypothetical protein
VQQFVQQPVREIRSTGTEDGFDVLDVPVERRPDAAG